MSEVKVNKISPRTNCGTVTLGDSGDTIALGAGASQTGFGSTGGISWQTSIKTTDFTAVSNEGYFVNTSGGSDITVTLPASPSAGNVVAIKDYSRTFGTNKVILDRNGSNMDGSAVNTNLTQTGSSIICVFMDSTKGWSFINEDTTTEMGASFVTATGGTTSNSPCGNFKIHTFTGPGTFCVSSAGAPSGSNTPCGSTHQEGHRASEELRTMLMVVLKSPRPCSKVRVRATVTAWARARVGHSE